MASHIAHGSLMKFDQSFICDDILTLMPFSINTEKKKKKKQVKVSDK